MQFVITALVVVAIVTIVAVVAKYGLRRATVYEYERGIKYTRGKFQAVIPPGQYWYLAWFTTIRKVDVRPRFASITGQEILSSDGVTLKVSLAANFEVVDPGLAINKVQDFQETLYTELQLALRQIIGSVDIDSLLTTREEVSKKLADMTQAKAQELGLRLISVGVKDIMFPGSLKEMFAQVVSARKEGLAALEKARGETAALRNLANAAQMVESNPGLMQLRLLQSLGGSTGNTLVLGLPGQTAAIPIRPRATQNKDVPPEPPEAREPKKNKRR
jgi:regulator of protease activity HflC (stomatin/prohibitin superfamily)